MCYFVNHLIASLIIAFLFHTECFATDEDLDNLSMEELTSLSASLTTTLKVQTQQNNERIIKLKDREKVEQRTFNLLMAQKTLEHEKRIPKEVDESLSVLEGYAKFTIKQERNHQQEVLQVSSKQTYYELVEQDYKGRIKNINASRQYRAGTALDFEKAESLFDEPLKIGLSIDGGGMRGIIPAFHLKTLSEQTKKHPAELFDFSGGSSIGGILAAGIVASRNNTPQFSPDDLISFFRIHGPHIFPYITNKNVLHYFDNLYSSNYLEQTLNNFFDDLSLIDTCKPVVITSVEASANTIYTFETYKAQQSRVHNWYLKDILRATSAAPTFFEAAIIPNADQNITLSFIDGGVWCNNPSEIVYRKMLQFYNVSAEKTALVSLGTGQFPLQSFPLRAGKLGVAGPIFETMMNTNSQGVDSQMKDYLGNRYMRLQTHLPAPIELDVIGEQELSILELVAEEASCRSLELITRFLLKNYDLKNYLY